jgi:RimJ/RimL family protein N-acetyltransferase
MNDKYLKTRRVLLRQYRNEDFDLLIELNSDPEVMKYLTDGTPGSREDVAAAVKRIQLYKKKYSGKLGVYSAELIQSGEFIGWFLLRPDKRDLENTNELELGYRLKKKFWGRGYATEVSLALVRKAFAELNAENVFATTLAQNLASRRVMEKIGMHFEGEFIDQELPRLGPAVLYRILRANPEALPTQFRQ